MSEPGGRDVGAIWRRRYEANLKHGTQQRGIIAPLPRNPQDALNYSVQVKATSPARVGIDYATGDFVVFQEHGPKALHGYVVAWDDLTQQQRNALIEHGPTNRRGKILRGG